MDIVSDGQVAVVGFGDSLLSFVGRAPAGISTFDVRTGALRWTGFDESSVMTSPVLRDSTMVYATSAGVLRKRLVSTGEVVGVDTLPGGSVMAPPAMIGDTVLFNLEPNHVCALLYSSLHRLWCRQLPDMRLMGHAAPAIAHGMVLVSGAATFGATSWVELAKLPRAVLARAATRVLFPTEYEVLTGQRFLALRLDNGTTVWRSPLYSFMRLVDGHIAGSAVVHDSSAVIVLPLANAVVGFNPITGAVRWTADGHDGRGPPLLLDGHVIVAGRDGVTAVRAAATGALECVMRRQDGYDRAGPTLVRGRLLFASMRGTIESIAADALLTCSGAGMTPATPATQASR